MKKLVIFLMALSLVFGVALAPSAYAQGKKKEVKKEAKAAKKEGPAQKVAGTVSSVSDTSLTVSHGTGATKAEDTFVINPQTKKEGNLENGAKVTVRYKTEGGNKVATVVKATAVKAKAEKPAKTPKTPKAKKG